jgi:uncharacterized DUF497 family protein
MSFEWDERKRAFNLAKHRIDFVDMLGMFQGPLLEKQDKRIDYGEVRLAALGRLGDDIYYVLYTWRGENRRLISARKAGYRERKIYNASYPRTSEEDEG